MKKHLQARTHIVKGGKCGGWSRGGGGGGEEGDI